MSRVGTQKKRAQAFSSEIPVLEAEEVGPNKGYPYSLAYLYFVKAPIKIGLKGKLLGNFTSLCQQKGSQSTM